MDLVAEHALQYLIYALEFSLAAFLLFRGRWKRVTSVFLYLVFLFAVDAVSRPYILYRYGFESQEYAYFFWLSDALLTIGAFLVVCALFRRACAHHETMWRHVRVMLAAVFGLIGVVSFFSISRNYEQLFTIFIVEFHQNLYFTCLVLTTLLYVLVQQVKAEDDELAFLVSGAGLEFAGPAACFALVHLTFGQRLPESVCGYLAPLCTMGMLLTWFYAVARTPRAVPLRVLEAKEAVATGGAGYDV